MRVQVQVTSEERASSGTGTGQVSTRGRSALGGCPRIEVPKYSLKAYGVSRRMG